MRSAWLLILCIVSPLFAAEPSREDIEFFEKRVRPVLIENCHKCHGEKQQKGGLRLDSLAAALKGGESGPAVVPGDPSRSPLVEAINYDPAGNQMPPAGKLSNEAIAALTEWVQRGAPWPASTEAVAIHEKTFDLRERAKHWSFQPIRHVEPPTVGDSDWPLNPIDQFVLARLEAAGLRPAGPADQRTFLRRTTFALTGLPPKPAEIDAFLADGSSAAVEHLAERLLASPHYGERWARHWLDLVRFAETGGHEFDYDIRHASPYRDYVIRAFNADVPYNQFVREHIAGDLLPEPRRDSATRTNESVIGTGFYWFGQGKHSPVDLRAEECDTVDNQLDVLGKTFLGLTVACARCHDHKFDPITQKDYYAFAGFLQSSRQTYADVSPPEPADAVLGELHDLTQQSQSALTDQSLSSLRELVERLPELMLGNSLTSISASPPLPSDFVSIWRKTLAEEAAGDRGHPFHQWVHWSKAPEQLAEGVTSWQREWNANPLANREALPPAFMDSWFSEGRAFQRDAQAVVPVWHGPATRPLSGLVVPETVAHSGTATRQLQGTLRSPTFTIHSRFIEYLACRRGGERNSRPLKDGQIHLIIDGFQYIKNPLYGQLSLQIADSPMPKWHRQDVSKFFGSRAYIEIEDYDAGEIVVERIAMHDGNRPPEPFNSLVARRLASTPVNTLEGLAGTYQSICRDTLDAVRGHLNGTIPIPNADQAATADVVNWLCRQPQLPGSRVEPKAAVANFIARRIQLEQAIPSPQYAIAMTDGSAENEHVLIRGNPRKPGEEVPRQFLEVAAKRDDSGRMDLADSIVDPANPLTARVIVNRLWLHHFGRGLVPTPDDFGKMGQPPSHPELLDWLAGELIRSGWSLKHIQRLIVTSQTYRMTSQITDPKAEELDPENKLLHRINVQRLEAEPIRDALLAVSGRLDDRMFGPSVMPHLTPFMEGRGRPGQSGPLDGAGRRSIYISVRRNFLSPLFLAFDFPTPFTTMGRRTTSNVPAQALALMNNPFVNEQAAHWSQEVIGATSNPPQRVRQLYVTAFSREPTADETAAALEFVASQSAAYGRADEPRAWQDLAHVLLNVKEFVFVE